MAGAAITRVGYAPDLFTREAVEFIRNQRQDQPFFLYLPYNYPHPNCEAWLLEQHGAEVPDLGIYEGTDWPDVQKGHAAMISRMDRDIGQTLVLLGAFDLDKNTLVLFTSDNGPHLGDERQLERHEYLYWEFYEHGSAQGVRWCEWKAVQRISQVIPPLPRGQLLIGLQIVSIVPVL